MRLDLAPGVWCSGLLVLPRVTRAPWGAARPDAPMLENIVMFSGQKPGTSFSAAQVRGHLSMFS